VAFHVRLQTPLGCEAKSLMGYPLSFPCGRHPLKQTNKDQPYPLKKCYFTSYTAKNIHFWKLFIHMYFWKEIHKYIFGVGEIPVYLALKIWHTIHNLKPKNWKTCLFFTCGTNIWCTTSSIPPGGICQVYTYIFGEICTHIFDGNAYKYWKHTYLHILGRYRPEICTYM
jgi:hypothetical protein